MNLSARLSLRQRIAGLVILSMVVVSATTFVMFEKISRQAEKEKLGSLKTQAVGLGERIGAQFFERYGDVQAFSLNASLQSVDKLKIVDALNNYTKLYGIYDVILIVDLQGRYIASNTIAPQGAPLKIEKIVDVDMSKERWFKAALAGEWTEDKAKHLSGVYFEDAHLDPIISKLTDQTVLGASFSTVIRNAEQQPIAVITARPGFDWVEGEIQSLYLQMKEEGLETSEITLLDKSGFVLVDYDPTENKGDLSVKHDFDNVIGKLNLAERGVESAKEAVRGKSGAMFALDARKKITQAAGFTAIKSSKFIESIGWGVLVRASRDELMAELDRATKMFLLAIGLCLFLASALSLLYASRLGKSLTKIVQGLQQQGVDLGATSEQVASASSELSASTTQQAAALQQTVSALDQVNAMINRNAENAQRSKAMSTQGQAAANRGKDAVLAMNVAIEEINRSNGDIVGQIDSGNAEIATLVKVISEIGAKTNVINDIVFQTKLLSFNASVEAARAGEHGRGFAVVAEEVGNLAQMSGTAAKEISQMLESSIAKVESTISSTRARIEKLVGVGKDKIEQGVATSKRCSEALDEIVQDVVDLGSMVSEIATASAEQAKGVQEISRAMGQLDQVTQQNAVASQQAAGAANQLNLQSEQVRVIVRDLVKTVNGSSKNAEANALLLTVSNESPLTAPPQPSQVLPFRKASIKDLKEAKGKIGDHIPTKKLVNSPSIPAADDPRFSDI